jgi:hypothetical protein
MGHISEHPKKDMVIIDIVRAFQGDHKHPVDINNVENFVRNLCRNFKIIQIGVDQHQSADTIQRFQKEGLPINLTNITPKYNMDMYGELIRRINTKHIIYPNKPEIKDELSFLQKKYAGWGWRIEAARGHLDDIPDAIANVCLLLVQNLGKRAEWSEMVRFIKTESRCPMWDEAYQEGYEDAQENANEWIDPSGLFMQGLK